MNANQFPPSRRLSVAEARAGAHAVVALSQHPCEFESCTGRCDADRKACEPPSAAADSREGCPGDDQPAEVFAANSMRHFSLTSLYLRIGLWPLALVVCGGLCVAAWRNFN